MKLIVSWCAVLALLGSVTGANAQIPASRVQSTPGMVNYQGRLTTAAGEMYSNGVYSIEFRVWDASSGGNVLWGAKYTAYVTEGYFNVMLGMPGGAALTTNMPPPSVGPTELWKALWFDASSGNNNERFLGIRVMNDVNGDPLPPANAVEAFPRQQMLCSPFAERAQMAQYARQSIDDFSVPGKLTADGQIKANGGMSVTGAVTVTGALSASANSTFANGITVNGAMADLNKGLDVDGGTAYLRAGVQVTGSAALNGGVQVTGDGTFSNNAWVKGNLTVDNDTSMDKLTLAGLENSSDAVLDFGGSYVVYADNAGGGGNNTRLVVGGPASGGEVTIGPRGSADRLGLFKVKSSTTTLDGGTVNFDNVSAINVKGGRPIVVRRYTLPANDDDDHVAISTGFSTADWSAMMIGFDWGTADIDEDDSEETFMCRMDKVVGMWYVNFQGHYHGNYADPVVDVMFVKRALVDDDR